MSIQHQQRQLDEAERRADEAGITPSQRRQRLAKVERLRVDLARTQAKEDRKLEERGARASRSARW